MSADNTGQIQRGRPFPPGQSGNPLGRPKGAKSKLTTIFISALAGDFEKYGNEAIARARADDPVAYLKLISSMIPDELRLSHELEPDIDYANLTFEEAGELADVEQRRRLIRRTIEGQ